MSSARQVVIRLLAIAVLLGWWGVGTDDARGQEEIIVIKGHVLNGTAEGGDVSGLTVIFHQHRPTVIDDLQTTTDAEGRFLFPETEYDPETLYGVSVDYQGAMYGTDLDLSTGSPPDVILTVYEATDSDTALYVSSVSIVLAQMDETARVLWVHEVIGVSNGTDTTYVPGPDPMKLLRFGLPPGAQELTVQTNLIGSEVLQVDSGFALTSGVPPGDHQVVYTYSLPFFGSEASLERAFPYGADVVEVLVPSGTGRLYSDQLEAPQTVTVEGRPYQSIVAAHLPRNFLLLVDLLDLQEPSLGDRLRQVRFELVAPAALGLLMASLAAFAIWKRPGVFRTRASGSVEELRQGLVTQIADLERDFEEGLVSEEQYRQERSELVSRLSEFLRGRTPDGD